MRLVICFLAMIYCFSFISCANEGNSNQSKAHANKGAAQKEISVSEYGFSEKAAIAHLAANTFATKVGQLLKSNYPSEVKNPKVEITTKIENGKEIVYITYTCKVVTTSEDKAQFYFDHRGTVAQGETMEQAWESVRNELNTSKKVEKVKEAFQKEYQNYSLPDDFVSSSSAKTKNGKYYYIAEYFITARKVGGP